MSEQFTRSFDQEQPTPKKKVETKKDPNGFWGKNVYEVRQKVEKMNKPEAKEFFDFWWLITQNKDGKRSKSMGTNYQKMINGLTNEYLDSEYQTFKGNVLTIEIGIWGDTDTLDKEYEVGPSDPKHSNQRLSMPDEGKITENDLIDPSHQHGYMRLKLSPTGKITIFTKDYIRNGVREERDTIQRKQSGSISGTQAEDFIKNLKNKYLDRYVTSDRIP